MVKWEYLFVRTFGGVVMVVNGQELGEMAGGQPMGVMMYEYLAERGAEGWEVVGMAGVREGSEIILKRHLVEEEDEMEMKE